jgi:hypothetical protein
MNAKKSIIMSQIKQNNTERLLKILDNINSANPYPDLSLQKYWDSFQFIEEQIEEAKKILKEQNE